jgi:hypothetical protein
MSTSVPLINVSLSLGKADLDRFVPKRLTIPGPERKEYRRPHAGSLRSFAFKDSNVSAAPGKLTFLAAFLTTIVTSPNLCCSREKPCWQALA